MTRALLAALAVLLLASPAFTLEPIPDKLVVLTFDDSAKSHYTVARPILKQYKFGATFFITEGFDFPTNPKDYMTWDEIAQLHRDGFEIGNHTRDHQGVSGKTIKGYSKAKGWVNIGEGDEDWPEVLKALGEIDYDGWATAEVGSGGEAHLKDVAERMNKVLELS